MATNSSSSTLQNQHGGSTTSLSLRSNVAKAPLPSTATNSSSTKSIDFNIRRFATGSNSKDSQNSSDQPVATSSSLYFKRGRTYSLTRQRSLTEIASETAASVFGSASDQTNTTASGSQAVEYLSGKLSNALSFLTSNVTASATSSPATTGIDKPSTTSFANAHVRSLSNLTDEETIYSNIDSNNPRGHDFILRFLNDSLPKPISVPQCDTSPTSPTEFKQPQGLPNRAPPRQSSLEQKFIHSEHVPSNGVVRDRILKFNEISQNTNSQERSFESPDKSLPAISSIGVPRHCRTPSGAITQLVAPHGFTTPTNKIGVITSTNQYSNSPSSPSERTSTVNGDGFSFLPRNNIKHYSKTLTVSLFLVLFSAIFLYGNYIFRRWRF